LARQEVAHLSALKKIKCRFDPESDPANVLIANSIILHLYRGSPLADQAVLLTEYVSTELVSKDTPAAEALKNRGCRSVLPNIESEQLEGDVYADVTVEFRAADSGFAEQTFQVPFDSWLFHPVLDSEQSEARLAKTIELFYQQARLLLATWEYDLSPLKQTTFHEQDALVKSRNRQYTGFFAMDEIMLRHRLFSGGWSQNFTRELFMRGDAVVVLPYDPIRDSIVLLEQFRIGALADGRSAWLWELVAGIVETGETNEQVAHREAREEAGCEITKLIPIHEYWVSPGGTNERISIYCGLVDSRGIGGIHGLPEENEDIRALVVSFEVALLALEDGIINNAASIIALQWLQLNRDKFVKN